MFTLNSFGNCATDLKGSAFRSCDIGTYGDALGIALLTKGSKITLDNPLLTAEEDWKARIEAMTLFPYLGIYNFEQNTPENERATSSTGVMSGIRDGKPQFTFSFNRGGCFHKSLYNKRGENRWDLAILFETGVLLAENLDDTVSGFNMGMFDVDTFKLQQGTDPQMSTAVIQLLDAYQFNANHQFFTWDTLGVNLAQVNGVIDVKIVYDPAQVPTGDEIPVKVVSTCNNDDVILGLDDAANWSLGGVQASSTTISTVTFDTDTNLYTITVTPALVINDTIAPKIIGTDSDVFEDLTGNLFKGQAATEIVGIPSV